MRGKRFQCMRRPGAACKKELTLRVGEAELWCWVLATKQRLIWQNQPRSNQGGEPRAPSSSLPVPFWTFSFVLQREGSCLTEVENKYQLERAVLTQGCTHHLLWKVLRSTWPDLMSRSSNSGAWGGQHSPPPQGSSGASSVENICSVFPLPGIQALLT